MRMLIARQYFPAFTLGIIYVFEEIEEIFKCKSIELPDKNNQIKISCIPAGTYTVNKIISCKKGPCFFIKAVPNRTDILIHVGNYAAGVIVDLKGCISPGLHFKDINNDTFIDITDSRKAMDILLTLLPDTFQLIII